MLLFLLIGLKYFSPMSTQGKNFVHKFCVLFTKDFLEQTASGNRIFQSRVPNFSEVINQLEKYCLCIRQKIYNWLENPGKNMGESGKHRETQGLKIEMLQAITIMMINSMMRLNMRMMMPSSLDPTTTLVLVLR